FHQRRERRLERRLVDLADARQRKRVEDLDPFRTFEFSESLTDEKATELPYVRRPLVRAQDDEYARLLAVELVRHRDELGVGNRRMHADERLDLLAADLLAATIDVVAQATFERVIRAAVDHMRRHHVARAVEAVTGERVAIG